MGRREPLGQLCSSVVGWDHEFGYDHMPNGIRCERPGRLRATGQTLCDDCYVTLLLKDKGTDEA